MKDSFDAHRYSNDILEILIELDSVDTLDWDSFRKILKKHPRDGKAFFSKEQLVAGYRYLKANSNPNLPDSPELLTKIQMKPMRTQSGVTPVTVLTKPFPCPGQCIFCPSDIRMPKSYLSDEPGAQRAERNNFDPYLQTYRRIKALDAIGHNIEKIEIIILGGTWSFYPESYQIWFIKRIFEAMNDYGEGVDQTVDVEAKIAQPVIPKQFDKNFLSKSSQEVEGYKPKPAQPFRGNEVIDKSLSDMIPTAYERPNMETGRINPAPTTVDPRQLPTPSRDLYDFNSMDGERQAFPYDTTSTAAPSPEWGDLAKEEFLFNAEEITRLSQSTYNVAVTKILKKRGGLLNSVESATWQELEAEQKRNEKAHCRSVGLVIETRPDKISPAEVIRIRRLGCTKTQLGFQSLDDEVLEKNKRGHKVAETAYAIKLLRQAGFKIHGHWMANLYGSTPNKDIIDYQKMFTDKRFRPDELKIYPCSLIETADLVKYYEDGLWQPYDRNSLLEVVVSAIASTPEYCRLTRIIRDIPGDDIMVGNKVTNFRQLAENEMHKRGIQKKDIRSREIKRESVTLADLVLDAEVYESTAGIEVFWQFIKQEDRKIAGFLRQLIPNIDLDFVQNEVGLIIKNANQELDKITEIKLNLKGLNDYKHPFLEELDKASVIREVHVYGKTVGLGKKDAGKAQHLGLGSKLIHLSKVLSGLCGYSKVAVISAIGTREYYKKRGFELDKLYQTYPLPTQYQK